MKRHRKRRQNRAMRRMHRKAKIGREVFENMIAKMFAVQRFVDVLRHSAISAAALKYPSGGIVSGMAQSESEAIIPVSFKCKYIQPDLFNND